MKYTNRIVLLAFILTCNCVTAYAYQYTLHVLPKNVKTQKADYRTLVEYMNAPNKIVEIDSYYPRSEDDLLDSFLVKAFSKVCFYARTTQSSENDYFDLINYNEDKFSLPDTQNLLMCLVKNDTGEKLFIQRNFKVLINGKMYFMPRSLLNYIGRTIPETLRYNWGIKYNVSSNYFYYGSNVLEYYKSYYNRNMDNYEKYMQDYYKKMYEEYFK